MADLHYILLVMTTLENGGYYSQDSELEGVIERYNEEYPRKDEMTEALKITFDLINKMDLPADSVWFRKSNFFTMLVELSKYLFDKAEKTGVKDLSRHVPAADSLGALLNHFSKELYLYKDSTSPYKEYYPCMYQGTNNRKSRVIRSEIFRESILKKI